MKKNTKMYSTAIAAALATSALVTAVPTHAETVTFKDVDSSNLFYEYITNLANRGVIEGYGDGTFRPTLDVRRDHAAKIIARVLELDTTDVVDPQFKDVPKNHPHYGEIAAIKEAGIISGDGYGSYLPEKTLTRGEMAKIIANAFNLEASEGATTPFTDIKGNMFEKYITALYENGVTNGKGNNKFDPNGVVTRGELTAFVVRAEQLNEGEVVDKATKVDSIEGDTIVVGGEVLALTEELKAVFNAKNAAALKDAEVELVVRYKDAQVASLAPIANKQQGEVVGIKGLALPNANTTFDAGNFVIPKVAVTAKGVTISNVSVSTFTVAKDATVTLTNVVAKEVAVEGALTLGKGSKVAEIIVTGDAKITLTPGVTPEKVTLEEGKTLADVVTNYDEVKDELKDVVVEEVKPGTTPPTTPPSTGGGSGSEDTGSETVTVTATANLLINNLINELEVFYSSVGTLTTVQDDFVFTFKNGFTTLQDVKLKIEETATNVDLEDALLNAIPFDQQHLNNLLKIDEISVNNVVIVKNEFTSDSTLGDIKEGIASQLTEEKIAEKLTAITGLDHDTAKNTLVSDFVKTKFDIKVTFNDNASTNYEKTVTLAIEESSK